MSRRSVPFSTVPFHMHVLPLCVCVCLSLSVFYVLSYCKVGRLCVWAGDVWKGGRCFYAAAVDAGLALHNCKCNVSGCCVMLLPLLLCSVCCIVEFRIVFAGPADIVCLARSRMLIREYVLKLCLCVLQLENMCVICYEAREREKYNAFACSLRITSRTLWEQLSLLILFFFWRALSKLLT